MINDGTIDIDWMEICLELCISAGAADIFNYSNESIYTSLML